MPPVKTLSESAPEHARRARSAAGRGIVSRVLARILLVAVSAALVVVLALRLGDHEACEDARRGVFSALTSAEARGGLAGHVEDVEERCRGTDALVAAAGALRTIGDDEQALRLARKATEREPDSFGAWRARAALARGAEATDARGRAQELNPRWKPARAPGADGGPGADAAGEGP